jgi:hypothetical protein
MLSKGTRWRPVEIRTPVIEALAHAFRRKRMLESGEFATV